ncbi:MAG: DUF3397 domain-containing protein [Bacillus sp. (in: firmicutes)]
MGTVLSWFIATIVTVPIFGYLIVFIGIKQLTKNHRKAVSIASNCSTFLFIISVHFIVKTIWNISLLWIILLLMIALAMLVVIVHHKLKDDMQIPRIIKGIWKVNGLVFMILYCILMVTGIALNVSKLF